MPEELRTCFELYRRGRGPDSRDAARSWRGGSTPRCRRRCRLRGVLVADHGDELQDRFVGHLVHGRTASAYRHHVLVQARRRLETGALVDLQPSAPTDVALFWQRWRLESPVLTAVADAVTAAATAVLRQDAHTRD
jgi:LysR family transcriptional regulator (chromosome initiation inhibitor)